MKQKITVWITKYALSQGIYTREVEISESSPDLATYRESLWEHYHGEGKDWHRTEEGAKQRAEEMRKAKIASLQKQLAKLEKLTF